MLRLHISPNQTPFSGRAGTAWRLRPQKSQEFLLTSLIQIPNSQQPNLGWTETSSGSKEAPSFVHVQHHHLFLGVCLSTCTGHTAVKDKARLPWGMAALCLTTRGSAEEALGCCPHPLPLSKAMEVPRTESDPVVSDQGDAPANSLVEVLLSLILQREREHVSIGVCWDSSSGCSVPLSRKAPSRCPQAGSPGWQGMPGKTQLWGQAAPL